MLKASINAGILKESLDAIGIIVDEGRFKIGSDGMTFRAVDAANVAMASIIMHKEAFEKYEAVGGEIGIDVKKLSDIIEMAGSVENVELDVSQDGKRMKVTVGEISCSVGLLDLSSLRKEPSPPSLTFEASVVLTGEDFRRGIKAAEKIGDSVALSIQNRTFCMETKGDVDEFKYLLPPEKLIEVSSGKARSLFSLEYLSDMCKVIGKAPTVKLELGNDYPLKISFEIANGKCEVEYYLAPRVEGE